ncbi:MAG TPA: flagellar hook-associated protein FlgK [Terriglobales bacterium]
MPGLTSTMLMSVQSLLADQAALQVTSNNISNANTAGYTREVPDITENTPTVEGGITYGGGVTLERVQSIRDTLLDLRISEENQQQSGAQAQVDSLNQIQQLFSDSSTGVGANMSAFFNSLSQLSTNPTSVPQRQAVITAAQNLASSFNQTSTQLSNIESSLNLNVSQNVNQVNSLTQQIAKLNVQVAQMEKLGQEPGTLLDQETQLVQQLSQLTDVNVIQTENGQTITTANGAALVVGGQNFALTAQADSTGTTHVFSQGTDITSSIQNGKLGGTLQVRDQDVPGVLNQLDTLASQFATAFNTAHEAGTDLNGNAGGAFFSAAAGAGAASSFSVVITDPNAVAASSDGSAGSNGNIANLSGVQTTELPSGASPTDSFSNIVFNVGNLTQQAQAESTAGTASLNQLQDQWGSISGVSIDEESTNLITYQRAFEAAARVISTVDELTQTVIGMGATS